MSASFHIFDKVLSPKEFSEHTYVNEHFEGLKTGQDFVKSWLNDKQFFDQKTSGSTGKPTIHTISRKNILASARRTAESLKLQPEMRALVCINMGYIGGKMMLARGLHFNWQLNLAPPASFANTSQVPEGAFDFAAMVPMQIENLLRSEEGIQLLNRIKKIIVGGAAMGKHLISRIQSLDSEIYATYGMTETVSHIALQRLNGPDREEAFHILSGVEHGLDDRNCLRLKADVTNNEWIQTNDVVEMQDIHGFRILGRADNIINTGGVKISAEMLEEKIAPLISAYTDAFSISSLPDDLLGEKIVLVCSPVLKSKNQIPEVLKASLQRFELPKAILEMEIPRTPSGKVDRAGLRAKLHEEENH